MAARLRGRRDLADSFDCGRGSSIYSDSFICWFDGFRDLADSFGGCWL